LPRDLVDNVTALVTLSKTDLAVQVGVVDVGLIGEVDRGLRQALAL
jgi:hypothetical protein